MAGFQLADQVIAIYRSTPRTTGTMAALLPSGEFVRIRHFTSGDFDQSPNRAIAEPNNVAERNDALGYHSTSFEAAQG
jgi:hypothetical protein